ncbi:hypothetical protein MHYP_G00313420 [Metynnis hypsauchen]
MNTYGQTKVWRGQREHQKLVKTARLNTNRAALACVHEHTSDLAASGRRSRTIGFQKEAAELQAVAVTFRQLPLPGEASSHRLPFSPLSSPTARLPLKKPRSTGANQYQRLFLHSALCLKSRPFPANIPLSARKRDANAAGSRLSGGKKTLG